jgi:hypothetical protein
MIKRILLSFFALISLMGIQAQDVINHAVSRDFSVNQSLVTLTSGDKKYYNTTNVSAIDLDQTSDKVTISTTAGADVFNGSVASIAFAKKINTENSVQITEAQGWLESAYVKFADFSGATSYHVYVKGGQYSDFTKIDDQLIRSYGTYNRADAMGLQAGDYAMKVVPVVDGIEVPAATTVSNLTVKAFNRDGYAHYNTTAGIGAYNNDGTLKQDARIIYVSKANAKTVSLEMQVDNKGKMETRTGIQNIIQAYEKGVETRPLVVRVIGLLKKSDMDELGSSAIGLQVKGKGQNMNLTIEGVGSDATFHGFGVLVRACKYVELRNLGVMMH